MSLTSLEKVKIGKRIKQNVADLNSGNLTALQKVKIGKQIKADVALLVGGAVETVQTLFQQIAQGVKDTLGAMEVFNLIKQEVERIGRDVIKGDSAIDSQLKDACVQCADLADAEGIA